MNELLTSKDAHNVETIFFQINLLVWKKMDNVLLSHDWKPNNLWMMNGTNFLNNTVQQLSFDTL